MIRVESYEDRKIENEDPAARQPMRVNRIIPAQSFAAHEKRQTDRHADVHTPARSDPLIVEGKLQEEGNAKRDRDDANPKEPASANAGLEIGASSRSLACALGLLHLFCARRLSDWVHGGRQRLRR